MKVQDTITKANYVFVNFNSQLKLQFQSELKVLLIIYLTITQDFNLENFN